MQVVRTQTSVYKHACLAEHLLLTDLKYKKPYWVVAYVRFMHTQYISNHALLNLLDKLGKRDKLQGLLSILSLFSLCSFLQRVI